MKRWSWLSLIIALFAVAVAIRQHNGDSGIAQFKGFAAHPSLFAIIDRSRAALVKAGLVRGYDACSCGNVVDPLSTGAACQLEGSIIPDCCCSYPAVERVNRDAMQPLLEELVKTPFFRYFKTDLFCECPLWPDDGMCSLKDCSVCECEAEEVPQPWRDAEKAFEDGDGIETHESCASIQHESDLDRTIQPSIKAKLKSVRDWKGYKNPWMPDDNGVEYSYINLVRNQERYTGYKGEHANRVWGAIYEQPCFNDVINASADVPAERRVFYKLISGMHSSITAHIAGDYLIDAEKGIWGPNLEMFKWRLGNPKVRMYVENLYFSYLFVLRAALKAGPILRQTHFDTGSPKEDARTAELMRSLVDNQALKHTCPIPFDEGRLWKDEGAEELRAQLQTAFHNITRIMDCVGCEKCKMWGKLQLLGIATSLKILFSSEDCSGGLTAEAGLNSGNGQPPLILERNEVIALVNLLERLSTGVEVVRSLSLQLADGKKHPQGLGAIQELMQEKLVTGLKQ
ncbi:hypothetical protein Ndes2526B_g02467 [Nannochloris sp. 'desiccata']|nr:hypothetical protein KSW81_007226 [Chlorella desiccata (nom. nud.)]KAH7621655.1 putative Endoplasmic reticulum oxidoreductin-1 [Chlorella desiccata (nom. nud.)]